MFTQSTRRVAASLITCIVLAAGVGCATRQAPTVNAPKAYSFWPAAPNEPRVQFLTAFNSSQDIAPEKSGFDKMVWGADGEQELGIAKPYGVRMWNGRVYVCDIRGAGVTVLDLRKNQTRMMGVAGAGTIRKAVDLAVAPDGTKYVVDAGQGAVLVFDANERYVRTIPFGSDVKPVGVAIHGNELYVVDFKNADVMVLDRQSGRPTRTVGARGGEDGQFIGPVAAATDAAGNLYVSDVIRARVQKFGPDGKFLLGFGEPGDRPGNFIRPKQIGVGSDGQIHVVDASFNNVQVFDPEGRVVGYYGSLGRYPGAMDLPAGLDVREEDLDLFARFIHPAFQAERLILVANQFGSQKVSVYAMGHLKPGKTVADIARDRGSMTEGTEPTTRPTTRPVTAGAAETTGGPAERRP